jgi:hypothetical protein
MKQLKETESFECGLFLERFAGLKSFRRQISRQNPSGPAASPVAKLVVNLISIAIAAARG